MGLRIKNSIIVCAYNEEKYLENCLNSLRNQIIGTGCTELIIIDNESEDCTGDIGKIFVDENKAYFSCKYIKIDNHVELSKSRNVGIKESVGDIVIFIDADAYVKSEWLKNLLTGFIDEEVDIVSGKVENLENESGFSEFIYNAYFRSTQLFGVSRLIGANMAFRRKVFEATGGFFNNIHGRGDEVAVATRYFSLFPNKKERFVRNAIVYNEYPDSILIWLKQQFREGISHIAICRLNLKNNLLYYIQNSFRFCNVIFWPSLPLVFGVFNSISLFIVGIVLARYIYRYKLFVTSFKNTFKAMGLTKAILSIPTIFLGTYLLDLGCIKQLFSNRNL